AADRRVTLCRREARAAAPLARARLVADVEGDARIGRGGTRARRASGFVAAVRATDGGEEQSIQGDGGHEELRGETAQRARRRHGATSAPWCTPVRISAHASGISAR